MGSRIRNYIFISVRKKRGHDVLFVWTWSVQLIGILFVLVKWACCVQLGGMAYPRKMYSMCPVASFIQSEVRLTAATLVYLFRLIILVNKSWSLKMHDTVSKYKDLGSLRSTWIWDIRNKWFVYSYFDLYQSLNRLPILNSQNFSMFPLAFVAGSLQGHWWGLIRRK